ncbi:MAG: trigger factor [Candidatus Saccharimonadales bacterium]
MQVSRTDISPTMVRLTVETGEPELLPIKTHVLGHFAGSVNVPGFRAGKVPTYLLEKHVDQRALLDEFMEHAVNSLYRRAVESEKLRPVLPPKVEVKKFVPYSDLTFEIEVDVVGNIKLPDYKKIKLAKPKATVSAEEVNNVISSLQKQLAERKEVDRPAKTGDEVVIDFTGNHQDGKPVSGGTGKDYPLLLGGNSFIPGFEDQIVGLKAGQTKEFSLTFPKDYGAKALAGVKVDFGVSVRKVHQLVEPKVDDALAAKAGPFKTVVELKADIKKQMGIEKNRQADRDFETELIKQIVTGSSVEVPDSLIDEQVKQSEETERRNLIARGQTWQEHLADEGVTEEQHRQRHRPDAAEKVKAGLVLSEIAEAENINVTPEEVASRIELLKGQYKDAAMQAELDKPENRQDIAARLLTEKVIARLVEHSQIS